jgi:hypothetical protein
LTAAATPAIAAVLITSRRDTLAFGALPFVARFGRPLPPHFSAVVMFYIPIRDFGYHIASNRCVHEP